VNLRTRESIMKESRSFVLGTKKTRAEGGLTKCTKPFVSTSSRHEPIRYEKVGNAKNMRSEHRKGGNLREHPSRAIKKGRSRGKRQILARKKKEKVGRMKNQAREGGFPHTKEEGPFRRTDQKRPEGTTMLEETSHAEPTIAWTIPSARHRGGLGSAECHKISASS